MSPRVIKTSRRGLAFLPFSGWQKAALHLDIGRQQIALRDGKETQVVHLESPLRIGRSLVDDLPVLQQAIEPLLSKRGGSSRALDVSISDTLARHWILQRPEGLATPEELKALAQHQLRSVFGDSVQDAREWAVQLDDQPFAQAWPGMALPKELIAMLVAASEAHGFALRSLQSRFVRAINQKQSVLAEFFSLGKARLYALETADSVTIGIRQGAHWKALRSHPPLACLSVPLATLFQRDCLAAGLALEACSVRFLEWPEAA